MLYSTITYCPTALLMHPNHPVPPEIVPPDPTSHTSAEMVRNKILKLDYFKINLYYMYQEPWDMNTLSQSAALE